MKRLEKGQGKKVAKKYAERILNGDGRYLGATAKQQEGICDATAMALWVQTALHMPSEVSTLHTGPA